MIEAYFKNFYSIDENLKRLFISKNIFGYSTEKKNIKKMRMFLVHFCENFHFIDERRENNSFKESISWQDAFLKEAYFHVRY